MRRHGLTREAACTPCCVSKTRSLATPRQPASPLPTPKPGCNRGFACSGSGARRNPSPATNELSKLQEGNFEAWLNRGVGLFALGQCAAALNCFLEAVRLRPEDHRAWYNRGTALHTQGRYSDALAAYDRALALDPRQSRAWLNKGATLQCRGNYEQAIRCYDRALKYDPSAGLAWRNRGFCLMQSERLEEALSSYERVLGINPRDTWVRKAKQATEEQILHSQPALSRSIRTTGSAPGLRAGNA